MKIAWFGLLDSDDATASTRALEHLVRLARNVVAQSHQAWSIDLISCGRDPGCQTLASGVERIVLPLSGAPRTVWDRVSWALPAAVASADLVHVHDGFSRSCEMALLVARQLHKPVCTTEWPVEGYWLSGELALRELADAVICHDVAVANSIATSRPVHLVACGIDVRDLGVPASWPANHCLPYDRSSTVGNGLRAVPSCAERASIGPLRNGTAPTKRGYPVPYRRESLSHDEYIGAGADLARVYRRLFDGMRRAAA